MRPLEVPDGFRVDVDGNIWTGAGDRVHCTSDGEVLIGKIPAPGKGRRCVLRRFDAGPPVYLRHTSLYAIHFNTQGA